MKTLAFSLVAIGCILGAEDLRSQSPSAAQSPQQALQTLKTQNQKLLEQQAASLQKLEELQKNAQQMRILARRT